MKKALLAVLALALVGLGAPSAAPSAAEEEGVAPEGIVLVPAKGYIKGLSCSGPVLASEVEAKRGFSPRCRVI